MIQGRESGLGLGRVEVHIGIVERAGSARGGSKVHEILTVTDTSRIGITVPVLIDVDIVGIHRESIGNGSLRDAGLLAVEVIIVTRSGKGGSARG